MRVERLWADRISGTRQEPAAGMFNTHSPAETMVILNWGRQ